MKYQSNTVDPLSLLRLMYVKSLVRYISTTRPRHQRNPSILCIHRFQFHIFYRRSSHRYHTYPGQNHDPFLSCVPSHALQSRTHKTIYMIHQSSALWDVGIKYYCATQQSYLCCQSNSFSWGACHFCGRIVVVALVRSIGLGITCSILTIKVVVAH